MAEERIFAVSTGPFTHAIFDAISDAILRTKRALPTLHECCFREASRGLERNLSNIWRRPFFPISPNLAVYFVAALRD